MADSILDCTKFLKADNSVDCWEFKYQIEKSGKIDSFCVCIMADEMTDPTSASEAKTLANAKAKAIKDAWTPVEIPSPTDVSANEGSVTL